MDKKKESTFLWKHVTKLLIAMFTFNFVELITRLTIPEQILLEMSNAEVMLRIVVPSVIITFFCFCRLDKLEEEKGAKK